MAAFAACGIVASPIASATAAAATGCTWSRVRPARITLPTRSITVSPGAIARPSTMVGLVLPMLRSFRSAPSTTICICSRPTSSSATTKSARLERPMTMVLSTTATRGA